MFVFGFHISSPLKPENTSQRSCRHELGGVSARRIPCQGSIGTGLLNLSSPSGALANGIPRNTSTFTPESVVFSMPRTNPLCVRTNKRSWSAKSSSSPLDRASRFRFELNNSLPIKLVLNEEGGVTKNGLRLLAFLKENFWPLSLIRSDFRVTLGSEWKLTFDEDFLDSFGSNLSNRKVVQVNNLIRNKTNMNKFCRLINEAILVDSGNGGRTRN